MLDLNLDFHQCEAYKLELFLSGLKKFYNIVSNDKDRFIKVLSRVILLKYGFRISNSKVG